MLIELTPAERHAQEIALPAIFDGGFHSDRIVWYTRLVVESGLVRGGASVIPELIAAMISESSLDNTIFGDANPDPQFGVGWMQMDTGYHVHSLENLLAIRSDPLHSLVYATDPANGLCKQGGRATWFNKQAWHAWEPAIIDPPSGWSPLGAAIDAYNEVTA